MYDEDDEPRTAAGPSRGRLVAIFAGVAVLGLVIGIGAAQLAGGDDDQLLAAQPVPTPTSVAPPAVTSAVDEPEEPEPEPSTTTSTTERDYRPIPEDATSERGLDFGFLVEVTERDGAVLVRFDRASFYTGSEAIERNGGKVPPDDYLIENTNPALRTFWIDPEASLIASNQLLDDPEQVERDALTREQFLHNTRAAVARAQGGVPVWLRHTDGLTGDVTALAEQYVP